MDDTLSTLQVVITDRTDGSPGVAVLVDGSRFGEHPVDLFELKRSACEPGERWILTCQCGVTECAGFWRGIEVEHRGDVITWAARSDYYPKPQYSNVDEPEPEHVVMLRYRFDRMRYVHAIREAFAVLRDHPRRQEAVVGFGFYESTLAELFDHDLALPGP